mmetsp:Transcript_7855/g.23622  ORF Transcript_7855/g.23622 Transcript_7855/m.23622 type:complete len:206 (-) Transcript_7855:640-1257(-)
MKQGHSLTNRRNILAHTNRGLPFTSRSTCSRSASAPAGALIFRDLPDVGEGPGPDAEPPPPPPASHSNQPPPPPPPSPAPPSAGLAAAAGVIAGAGAGLWFVLAWLAVATDFPVARVTTTAGAGAGDAARMTAAPGAKPDGPEGLAWFAAWVRVRGSCASSSERASSTLLRKPTISAASPYCRASSAARRTLSPAAAAPRGPCCA